VENKLGGVFRRREIMSQDAGTVFLGLIEKI
jgi:hypothetical protein